MIWLGDEQLSRRVIKLEGSGRKGNLRVEFQNYMRQGMPGCPFSAVCISGDVNVTVGMHGTLSRV